MHDLETARLHPWSVLSAMIFELDSDEIVKIMSFAGLFVDWSLSEKENFSNRTRKRAYRPRIDDVFNALSEADRLRVAWTVSKGLISSAPDKKQDLADRLFTIGWAINDDSIVPASESVAQLFFPHGTDYDAYVRLRTIMQSARDSLIIVDPYVDSTVLSLIASCDTALTVNIVTTNTPSDFGQELTKFQRQHKRHRILLHRTTKFHDRFLVLDQEECFHLGASIKDAGKRAFMISKISDYAIKFSLMAEIQRSLDKTAQG